MLVKTEWRLGWFGHQIWMDHQRIPQRAESQHC